VFLIAAGLTYAVAGTLNIAHLSERLAGLHSPGITTVLASLFLIAFGIKAAVFPLFFWLPASYHTPPVAVTALFGGLLTKVGVYSMWRVLTMVFPQDVAYLQPLILTIAGLTMVTGVLGAVAQTDFRRLLSFHIVSQIGYLLMGFGLFTEGAMAGAVFFMVHVILAKTALFFVSGIAYEVLGSYDLKKLGGLRKSHPGVALLFLLAAFALAGLPPLSGFWAKLALVQAGLEARQYAIVAVALGVSLLTLYSMTKIWHEAFWKKPYYREENPPEKRPYAMRLMLASTGAIVTLVVAAGILVEPLYNLSQWAANGLMQPGGYVQTVLAEEAE
jgi:multicomponent Na+:H+ antiporter subunit D